jgi:hypothetical protein
MTLTDFDVASLNTTVVLFFAITSTLTVALVAADFALTVTSKISPDIACAEPGVNAPLFLLASKDAIKPVLSHLADTISSSSETETLVPIEDTVVSAIETVNVKVSPTFISEDDTSPETLEAA